MWSASSSLRSKADARMLRVVGVAQIADQGDKHAGQAAVDAPGANGVTDSASTCL